MPHLDELGWLVQERRLIDLRSLVLSHLENYPTMKLFQLLNPLKRCNLLVFFKEDILGILKYM